MSYIQFRQRCLDCKAEWNAAFGIVGTTQIAAPPTKCPKCESIKIERIQNTGWGNLSSKLKAPPAGIYEATVEVRDALYELINEIRALREEIRTK